MSTATDLVKFSPADAEIAVMRDSYMGLTIAGVTDKEGFDRVHKARMVVKNKQVDIEKRRKELKADALEYGRLVDGEAKRLTGLLEPIKMHLQSEEDRIVAAKDAIKNAARLKAEAEERARKEAEEAAMRAEQERQAEERRKLEEERAKLEAERAKIEAEKRRIADEEAARQRAIAEAEAAKQRAAELERARQEAAERAKRETEERLKREAEQRAAEAKRKAEAEETARLKAEAARLKAEAMRPDREKIESVADAVAMIEIPQVSVDAAEAAKSVRDLLSTTAGRIRNIAKGLGQSDESCW